MRECSRALSATMNVQGASRGPASRRAPPARRTCPQPLASGLHLPWLGLPTKRASREADPRLEAAFFEALCRPLTSTTIIDAAVNALIEAGASSSAPPVLDPSPWAVAHTSGLLGWRAFSGKKALASQAIDTTAGTVVSRAEALGGRVLSTAAGTCAVSVDDPRTLEVSVERVEVGPGPCAGGKTDGAGRVVDEDGKEWTVRLPAAGKGAVTVLYAGRDVRVFRGAAGGVAVHVRAELLDG